MPTEHYALEKNGPKTLEISWGSTNFSQVTVKLEGKVVGTFPVKEASNGKYVELPDGSALQIQFKGQVVGQGFQILRNGKPLPGYAFSEPLNSNQWKNLDYALRNCCADDYGVDTQKFESFKEAIRQTKDALQKTESSFKTMSTIASVFVVLGVCGTISFRGSTGLTIFLVCFGISVALAIGGGVQTARAMNSEKQVAVNLGQEIGVFQPKKTSQ